MNGLTLVGGAELVDSMGRELPKSPYGQIKVPNIRVVGPRLLIQRFTGSEGVTQSGIVIPASARQNHERGVVLVKGDGVILADGTRLDSGIEVGDEIIYAKFSGTELTLEDAEYLIIQESDVRCVLTYVGKVFTFAEEQVD